ncbi:MAG: SHOCT domain-containing protein [Bacteroidales bacterium]|jgi:uncharacterized membrane protein|nr:SHOCT domain-containing protein [Bacteroidales bacterium]
MVYVFRILILGVIVLLFYAIIKGILSIDSNKKKPKKTSVADELLKLQNLKEEGIITEEEFQQMKKRLLK